MIKLLYVPAPLRALPFLFAVVFFSCHDDPEPEKRVTLEGFSPQVGGEGDLITITGSNFSDQDKIQVTFGDYYSTVLSANEHELKVQLPLYIQTCGNVTITVVNDTTVLESKTSFELACPSIERFSPQSGDRGDLITIYGANFTPDVTRIKVRIGSSLAQVISASPSIINVKLGHSYSGDFPVNVQIEQKIGISTELFTVNGPLITKVSQQTIGGCEPIIISGSDFSAIASENEVFIGYLKGEVISATPNELVVSPPYNLKELEEATTPIVILVSVAGRTGTSLPINVATETWKEISPTRSVARWRAMGFGIDRKGYIGTGSTITDMGYAELVNDFWEYDAGVGTWKRMADLPGVARLDAVGLNIGDKGYVGLGGDHSNVLFKDFWEFDPSTNSWEQMPDFPGEARAGAISFSVAGNGYVGMGWGFGHTNDLWKFDPTSKTWTKESEYPGAGTDGMVCFVINDKAYIGAGFLVNDFWEYTPSTKQWRQLSNIPETFVHHGVSLSYQGSGIMATGGVINGERSNRVWKYESSLDKWTRLPDFAGEVRNYAVGFTLGHTFAIGTGSTSFNIDMTNDFYRYACP